MLRQNHLFIQDLLLLLMLGEMGSRNSARNDQKLNKMQIVIYTRRVSIFLKQNLVYNT